MKPVINSRSVRRLGASVLFCLILFGMLGYASAVLRPTRSLLTREAGAAWDGFLKQPRGSIDVVYFGNSHVFDGVDPSVVWKSQGITGYVMAGPVQPLAVSRHYVAEVLRTQRPKVVAFDLSVLSYNERNYVSEFQLINVGYMPRGLNKVRAALVDTPRTDRTGALVDLWAYHSRWHELRPADFNLSARRLDDAFLKGFHPMRRSRPVTAAPRAVSPPSASILAAEKRNIGILRELGRSCEARDIELLLFLTPTGPPGSYSASLKRTEAALSGEFDNVTFLDLSAPDAVPGLSYGNDFFDGGHLTARGAEKSSKVLAAFLADTYQMKDHRGDPAYAHWDRDVQKHDAYVRDWLSGRSPK